MRAVTGSRGLLLAVAGLSAASAVLAAYAAFAGHSAPPSTAAAAACSCDDEALRRELSEAKRIAALRANDGVALRRLEERVAVLERAAGQPPRPAAPPASADAATDIAGVERQPPEPRAFKSFQVPNPRVTVRQEAGGAIAVTNSDPALTGQSLVVEAIADDGSVHELLIIVPAPGS